ncbi:small terminase subunit-like protein [Aeromonas phage HJG]|uniref:Small terminase subunit-like protein n=1 Tax=Aeromonas phage MJG TaxID=2510451 RepID=A0A5J6A0V0_9CAUD|nr:small terminase subunit-like protein [Aeromonas phage MJG]QBJ01085.1 small terminase subunit-like protein [Aeromonas phage HJG]
MADMRPNKKAASEDEVGLVHKLTTTLYVKRLQHMIDLVEQGAAIDEVFNDKVVKDAGNWAAQSNGITCAAPEADEESALHKRLQAIKAQQSGRGARATGTDNVIPFLDEENS